MTKKMIKHGNALRSTEEIKSELFARIDEVGKREDNWDGRGSKGVSAKTVANAKKVMGGLVDTIADNDKEYHSPGVIRKGDK